MRCVLGGPVTLARMLGDWQGAVVGGGGGGTGGAIR